MGEDRDDALQEMYDLHAEIEGFRPTLLVIADADALEALRSRLEELAASRVVRVPAAVWSGTVPAGVEVVETDCRKPEAALVEVTSRLRPWEWESVTVVASDPQEWWTSPAGQRIAVASPDEVLASGGMVP